MPHTYIGRMEEEPWTDLQFKEIKKLSADLIELSNMKKSNIIINNKDMMLLIQQEITDKRKRLRSAWRMLGHQLDIPTP
jgi:hypothetical protein